MPLTTDQTGRVFTYSARPKRIISLVPSQTELLFDLGLDKEVVGITKFCIHPHQWFYDKTRIGGTKNIKMEIIQQLKPDLILANKEENIKEQIEELEKQITVYVTDINNLQDTYEMIADISILTGREEKGTCLVHEIHRRFNHLAMQFPKEWLISCAYLIWRDPYMTIGGDTFINDMLQRCGMYNVFANKKRYPEITVDQLQTLSPQLLFLPSEPYPFTDKHVRELQSCLPNTRILLVNGEMFSWYGSRLLLAPIYFEYLLHTLDHSIGPITQRPEGSTIRS